jgi:hypothetical protein
MRGRNRSSSSLNIVRRPAQNILHTVGKQSYVRNGLLDLNNLKADAVLVPVNCADHTTSFSKQVMAKFPLVKDWYTSACSSRKAVPGKVLPVIVEENGKKIVFFLCFTKQIHADLPRLEDIDTCLDIVRKALNKGLYPWVKDVASAKLGVQLSWEKVGPVMATQFACYPTNVTVYGLKLGRNGQEGEAEFFVNSESFDLIRMSEAEVRSDLQVQHMISREAIEAQLLSKEPVATLEPVVAAAPVIAIQPEPVQQSAEALNKNIAAAKRVARKGKKVSDVVEEPAMKVSDAKPNRVLVDVLN